jgi:hypothetical protein
MSQHADIFLQEKTEKTEVLRILLLRYLCFLLLIFFWQIGHFFKGDSRGKRRLKDLLSPSSQFAPIDPLVYWRQGESDGARHQLISFR